MSELSNNPDEAVEAGGELTAVAEVPVGELLRQAREARGLAVAEIAQTLKLGSRQVEALETGEWDRLPGPTFIRGFVRNYARLVQIDPAPLMELLDRIIDKPVSNLDVPASRPASMPISGGRVSRRDRNVVLAGLGLVLVAGLAYFLMPGDLSAWRDNMQSVLDSISRKEAPAENPSVQQIPAGEPVFPPGTTPQQVMNPQVLAPAESAPTAPTPPEAAPAAATAAPVAVAPVPSAAPAASTPQLRFVFDKESWLEVRDRDNRVVFSQRLPAGAEQTIAGNGPLSVVVGYAPGAHVYWRGQPVDLVPHTRGEVARLVLE